MKCLETRRRAHGMKWRRYRDAAGKDHVTWEVPAEMLRTLGVEPLMEEFRRSKQPRPPSKRDQVLRLVAEKWKPLAIAHEMGVSAAYVQRLMKEQQTL